ncbi:hypothetical protein IHE44_0008861 [Lamprotornis superbus]|uniref:Uncharacterized protein n=1 Tax=Lamprotornis superbus TaxID=245042 RepID=A0A835NHC2_9PASS|nr:hypothetical protein IHE44_0008861 [Lamprotornis superbus]
MFESRSASYRRSRSVSPRRSRSVSPRRSRSDLDQDPDLDPDLLHGLEAGLGLMADQSLAHRLRAAHHQEALSEVQVLKEWIKVMKNCMIKHFDTDHSKGLATMLDCEQKTVDEPTVQILKVLFCCSILWPLGLVLAVPGSSLGLTMAIGVPVGAATCHASGIFTPKQNPMPRVRSWTECESFAQTRQQQRR